MHPWIGRRVGNYTLRALLGQGGMGLVFAAEHAFFGDRVAVKVLHRAGSSQPDQVRRFFQEAKTTREIQHPNIVRVIDFGQMSEDGSLYLVMELLEGASLADALRLHDRLGDRHAAQIGAQIADGMAAAHAADVVHRDLKPANVFLSRAGAVKVVDFGIAKVLRAVHQTAVGITLGTPQYMAPEQIRMGGVVGPSTDVYALGVVLFRMCTGRLPFDDQRKQQVLEQHLSESAPAASLFAPVPARLDRLIASCLEKEPAARPASMLVVRDELRAIAEASADPDLPLPLPPSIEAPAPDKPSTAATATERAKPPKPSPPPTEGSSPALAATVPLLPAAAPPTVQQTAADATTSASIGRPRAAPRPLLAALLGAVALGGATFWWLSRPGATAPLPPQGLPAPPTAPRNPSPPIVDPRPAVDAPPRPQPDPPSRRPIDAPAGPAHSAVDTPHPPTRPHHHADLALGRVSVQSEPAGATVIVERAVRGVTPLHLSLPLPSELLLTMPGYRPATERVSAAGEVRVKLVPLARPGPPAPAEGLD